MAKELSATMVRRLEGGVFIEAAKQKMREEHDKPSQRQS
jgi:hypothetical protein